jgi:hypothetical protein
MTTGKHGPAATDIYMLHEFTRPDDARVVESAETRLATPLAACATTMARGIIFQRNSAGAARSGS